MTQSCDWKSGIAQDRMISQDLRLLIISEDQMTGTGAWGAVVVLRSIDGQLKAAFHDRFENGADIGEATADKLVVVVKFRGRRDAQCCLSGELSWARVHPDG